MKNSAWIIAIIALAISACTSQKQATSYVNDDVYNTSSQQAQVPAAQTSSAVQGAQVVVSPDKAKVQKPASSTFEDDYNDYSYASRIDRFSSKDTTVGYFDESYSSGSQGGSDPNVSIYMGAGYGGYGPSYSFGVGWGYPYSNWGWDYGWGYPYYGYGYGYPYYGYGWGSYYDPWYGYGCCCGYYDTYPPYYTSNYYGSRTSLYRTDGGSDSPNARSSDNNANNANNAGNVRNENNAGNARNANNANNAGAAGIASSRVEQGSAAPSPRTTQPSVRSTPSGQETYRYTRPANEKQTVNQRAPKQGTGQVQRQTTRQQPAPRYVKPGSESNVQRSGTTQSYSSPVYRQPKSSQEYLAPRSQNPGTTRVANQNSAVRNLTGSSGSVTRQNTTPGNNKTYNNPSRSGSSGVSTTPRSGSQSATPARSGSNNSYSSPSRSGSSGSYSTPSNSNSGSYSAPSRSGGGSGGSSGGSSGGGGGRRR